MPSVIRTVNAALRLAAGLAALGLAAVASLPAAAAVPATCTAEDFAAAVDQAGARLRAFNAEANPRLQERVKALQAKKGWSDAEREDRAYEFLHDTRLTSLDEQADELLANIDSLGTPPADGPPDCSKLAELQAASSELLAVMKAKSQHALARIDAELGGTAVAAAAPPAVPQAPKPAEAKPAPKPPVKPATTTVPQPPAAPPAQAKRDDWAAVASPAPPAPLAPPVAADDVLMPEPSTEGYAIEDIREVARGFFGTISTELAGVIEHAFRRSGRPSAYILGQEGGGAFLAGVRYGNGTLYPRQGAARPVHWQGPSLGYDFGAAGSRTLFLIYGLKEPDAIHRRFAGVDGSAYLVGGVGLTYLRGGDIVLAPIRTGLGLRLGASVGYLRFTPKASWNPF